MNKLIVVSDLFDSSVIYYIEYNRSIHSVANKIQWQKSEGVAAQNAMINQDRQNRIFEVGEMVKMNRSL